MRTYQAPERSCDECLRSMRALREELLRLADQIQWKNHRASEEIKLAVQSVASELRRASDSLSVQGTEGQACTEHTTRARNADSLPQSPGSAAALSEAAERLALLGPLVQRALSGVSASATFIGDTAKMKLALQRLDDMNLAQRMTSTRDARRNALSRANALVERMRQREGDELDA